MTTPNKNQAIVEVVERLTPWAHSLAFFRLEANEIEDAVAEMRVEAIGVCLEIEQGSRPRPRNLDVYIKQVMRNALTHFLRKRQREPRSLKAQELQPYARLLVDVSEGEEEAIEVPGWRGLRSPVESDSGTRRPSEERQHFLARFLAFVAQEEFAQSLKEKHRQSVRQVEAIPDDRVRTMVMLYFQGHGRAAIARKLSVSRAAVSQALQRHLTAWGLDEEGGKRVRYAWLYASLEEAIKRGRKSAGAYYELPQLGSGLPDSFIAALPARMRGDWTKRRSGPRVRTADQYSPELCLAEEREVYKAIKGTPSLEAWTDDLAQEDIRDIIEASEPLDPWDEYDDSTWLDLP